MWFPYAAPFYVARIAEMRPALNDRNSVAGVVVGAIVLIFLSDRRVAVTSRCNDGEQAAKIIQDALSIESDDVVNYVFPRTWPADRERRAC